MYFSICFLKALSFRILSYSFLYKKQYYAIFPGLKTCTKQCDFPKSMNLKSGFLFSKTDGGALTWFINSWPFGMICLVEEISFLIWYGTSKWYSVSIARMARIARTIENVYYLHVYHHHCNCYEVLCKKNIFKNSVKLTGKYLGWNLF